MKRYIWSDHWQHFSRVLCQSPSSWYRAGVDKPEVEPWFSRALPRFSGQCNTDEDGTRIQRTGEEPWGAYILDSMSSLSILWGRFRTQVAGAATLSYLVPWWSPSWSGGKSGPHEARSTILKGSSISLVFQVFSVLDWNRKNWSKESSVGWGASWDCHSRLSQSTWAFNLLFLCLK